MRVFAPSGKPVSTKNTINIGAWEEKGEGRGRGGGGGVLIFVACLDFNIYYAPLLRRSAESVGTVADS